MTDTRSLDTADTFLIIFPQHNLIHTHILKTAVNKGNQTMNMSKEVMNGIQIKWLNNVQEI